MYCVLYVVRCNVVFYYKIDVHVGMLRKKHQWKIAEFQWLDIFVLAKASGWLSGFPVQCVDGWLKSCLTSWPVGSLTIDSVSAEQSVNESIYCGSVVSYGPIKRSACVFLCVLLTSPYICGRLWLSAHRASAKLEAFFVFSISAVWCRKTCCTDQLTVLDIPLPYRLISLTQSHAQLAEYMYMTNSVSRIINRNCYVMVSYVFSYVLLLGTHFFLNPWGK